MQILSWHDLSPAADTYRILWDATAQEAAFVDIPASAVEDALERLLDAEPRIRLRYAITTFRRADTEIAAERLSALCPELQVIAPYRGNWDASSLAPLRLGGQSLRLVSLGKGHFGIHGPSYCLCGAVWDIHGQWLGDALGRQFLRHLSPHTRLYALDSASQGILWQEWQNLYRRRVVDLASIRSLRYPRKKRPA
ncbi:MAG: hypothetical protein ACP5D5_09615 [Acidithiobacillus sp.]|uniref:hypothetical protein n=1 Tax=Acidithiobacillus sp. TaxID=1872118 RepID=UPI003D05F941